MQYAIQGRYKKSFEKLVKAQSHLLSPQGMDLCALIDTWPQGREPDNCLRIILYALLLVERCMVAICISENMMPEKVSGVSENSHKILAILHPGSSFANGKMQSVHAFSGPDGFENVIFSSPYITDKISRSIIKQIAEELLKDSHGVEAEKYDEYFRDPEWAKQIVWELKRKGSERSV